MLGIHCKITSSTENACSVLVAAVDKHPIGLGIRCERKDCNRKGSHRIRRLDSSVSKSQPLDRRRRCSFPLLPRSTDWLDADCWRNSWCGFGKEAPRPWILVIPGLCVRPGNLDRRRARTKASRCRGGERVRRLWRGLPRRRRWVCTPLMYGRVLPCGH